ncbi:glycoside hydrolase family 89 protein [Chiua virens]|nr:glycoside hydrolase family 89 protein [Chiua virens]
MRTRTLGTTLLALLSVLEATSRAIAANATDGLYALVQRRIPAHSQSFNFTLAPPEDDANVLDTFTLSDAAYGGQGQPQVDIQCSSVSACARGLYTYLTEYGGVDIWWTGSRLDKLPNVLPSIGTPVTRTSLVKYRYFFNTVTFSYTTAFYTFDDWALLLDWMALRGINLPLAWVGYEYVLIQVFREAGLTDATISSFLSGPPFQAWNRSSRAMVELGMTPVMPSFTGFVPAALSVVYPNASIVVGGQWSGFPSAYTNVSFLEPFDPLFSTLQTSFIDKQAAAYGNVSHIYTLDQYNENNPYSGNISYLASVASSTFASLRDADPDAVWMMQGWMFFSSESFWTTDRVQAYLGGVPGNDSMIILDLYSEAQPQWQRLDAYYGSSGSGNMGFEGNFVNVTVAPVDALTVTGVGSMVGMGLTPEGFDLGNEIIYDVLLDQAWSPTPINRTSYIDGWVARRYNVDNLPQAAVDAWQLLGATVYNNQNPSTQATVKSILELAPALSGLVNRTGHHPTMIFYDTNTTIVPALQMLINASQASDALTAIPEFQFDLVDVARQLLANRFIPLYESLVGVFNASDTDATAVETAGVPLLTLLADLDALLCTNTYVRLSTWLDAARGWSHGNVTYAAYLEYTARNQITLWGPTGEINDYASKQWAGLVRYYAVRWAAFVGYLVGCKWEGRVYDADAVNALMIAIGEEWDGWTGETGASDDVLAVVQSVASKYA